MNPTIRWRLTLWYGATMAICFAVFGITVYVLTSRSQLSRIDFELSEELHELQHDVMTVLNRDEVLNELRAEFGNHPDYEFEILQADGSVFFQSQRLQGGSLRQPLLEVGADAASGARLLELPNLGRYRVKAQLAESPHGRLLMSVAIPLESVDKAQRTLWNILWLAGPLALLIAMVGGYGLARRALSPVDRMTALAEQITAQRLDQRLSASTVEDELSRLARTLNAMMDRLQRSFSEMRRFTADAAHELRTPISLLRTQLDVALRSNRSPEEYRKVLLSLREDVAQFGHLASQLLELSREDAGVNESSFTVVAVRDVLLAAVNELRFVAEQKSQSLNVGSLDTAFVLGDVDRLKRLFVNLLDNAIKFTPPNGHIGVSLTIASNDDVSANPKSTIITVQDTGCGIAPEHLPHIFDRFYRADLSRGVTNGTGLGLAICQAIVTAHHGKLTVNSTLGQGTAVEVSLPTMS